MTEQSLPHGAQHLHKYYANCIDCGDRIPVALVDLWAKDGNVCEGAVGTYRGHRVRRADYERCPGDSGTLGRKHFPPLNALDA